MKKLEGEIRDKGRGEVTREAIHQTIEEKIYGPAPLMGGASSPRETATPSEWTSSSLPDYAKDVSPEVRLRVENLLDTAWHNGKIFDLLKAVRDEDPLIMKLTHDAITEKLYDAFRKRGILK